MFSESFSRRTSNLLYGILSRRLRLFAAIILALGQNYSFCQFVFHCEAALAAQIAAVTACYTAHPLELPFLLLAPNCDRVSGAFFLTQRTERAITKIEYEPATRIRKIFFWSVRVKPR